MRFCDFFIEYKTSLKEIPKYIPWVKLPLYRKIGIVALFICFAVVILLFIIQKDTMALLALALSIIFLSIFLCFDSAPKRQSQMIENFYKPYSKKRIEMVIKLLNVYNIEQSNASHIDSLITCAKNAQSEMNPFSPMKKTLKLLWIVIFPILAYVMKKVADKTPVESLVVVSLQLIAIIICTFAIFYALFPLLRNLFYSDYDKYEDLIYDLNQVKIFQKSNATFNPVKK